MRQRTGELAFYYGTMACGKSTLALQMQHTLTAAGCQVELYTKLDRREGHISSRLGIAHPARSVSDELDLYHDVTTRIADGDEVDVLICDEVQFYAPGQIDQLARLVDEVGVDVLAFGLLTDYTSRLFPGSRRLIEVADRREELQLSVPCWCGRRGVHNTRFVEGHAVGDGPLVLVGDTEPAEVQYTVLCRRHYHEALLAASADVGARATREDTLVVRQADVGADT